MKLSKDGDRSSADAIVLHLSEMTAKVEMGGEDRRLSPKPYGQGTGDVLWFDMKAAS